MAYLQITLRISANDRTAASVVYARYKQPFLTKIKGARSKELLVREEDVQVLHGFDSVENAKSYLESDLFTRDVVGELKPLLQEPPAICIYKTA